LSIRGSGTTARTRDEIKLEALNWFIAGGVASGDLKPTIAGAFPFENIVEAHRHAGAGEQIDKIMVTI